MQFTSGDLFKLTTSSHVNSINHDEQNNSNISEIEIKIKNSENIDKKKLIKFGENTTFEFNCDVKGDHLTITLSEVDVLAPFVYTTDLTINDMIEAHRMFMSCDTLEIVKEHIVRLFEDRRVNLEQREDEEITLIFQGLYISYVDEFKITLERKMTENKDKMLMKLYSSLKEKNKILDDIKDYLEKGDDIEIDEIIKKIKGE